MPFTLGSKQSPRVFQKLSNVLAICIKIRKQRWEGPGNPQTILGKPDISPNLLLFLIELRTIQSGIPIFTSTLWVFSEKKLSRKNAKNFVLRKLFCEISNFFAKMNNAKFHLIFSQVFMVLCIVFFFVKLLTAENQFQPLDRHI